MLAMRVSDPNLLGTRDNSGKNSRSSSISDKELMSLRKRMRARNLVPENSTQSILTEEVINSQDCDEI